MKAKEHAAIIIATPDDPVHMVDQLEIVVLDTVKLSKTRFTIASMGGALREGFTKWKSIVAQVEAAIPGYPIENGLFPKMLAAVNPVLFSTAVDEKVFLGYDLDAEDRAGADLGRGIVDRIMRQEMEATMKKQMKAMGLGSF